MVELSRSESAPAWLESLSDERVGKGTKAISRYQENVERVMDLFVEGSTITSELALMDGVRPRGIQYKIGDTLNCGRTGVVKAASVGSDISLSKALKFMWQKDYTSEDWFESYRKSDSTRRVSGRLFQVISPSSGLRSARCASPDMVVLPYLSRSNHEVEMLLRAQECSGVIRLEDVFYSSCGYAVIVMPLIRTTVHSFMMAYEKLPISVASCIIRQIAQTLVQLHSMEPECIIHGDIKPQNILMTEDSKAILIDFGSSSLLSKSSIAEDSGGGVSSSFEGSLAYAPPECLDYLEAVLDQDELVLERIQGGHETVVSLRENNLSNNSCSEYPKRLATDVWCLGMASLEMLIGWTPFTIGSLFQNESGKPAYSALDLLRVTTDERFIKILLDEAGKTAFLTKESIEFLKKCLTINPLKRTTVQNLLQSDKFLNNNKSILPDRLETIVKITREQFLPPGFIHGVTPIKKPNRYVPAAFIIMQKALKQYHSAVQEDSTPHLKTNNNLIVNAALSFKSFILPETTKPAVVVCPTQKSDIQKQPLLDGLVSISPTTKPVVAPSTVSWIQRLANFAIPFRRQTQTEPDLRETEPDLRETEPDIRQTERDLEQTEPDLRETEPDLREAEPDLRETEPDLRETEPDLQPEITVDPIKNNQDGGPNVDEVRKTPLVPPILPSIICTLFGNNRFRWFNSTNTDISDISDIPDISGEPITNADPVEPVETVVSPPASRLMAEYCQEEDGMISSEPAGRLEEWLDLDGEGEAKSAPPIMFRGREWIG